MDLKKFDFPEVRDVDLVFPTFHTDPALLAEATARGFYDGHTAYNDLFNTLFFKGATLNFKPRLDEKFKIPAARYMKAFMGSFSPKHEEKEAICAMLLSELVEEPKG